MVLTAEGFDGFEVELGDFLDSEARPGVAACERKDVRNLALTCPSDDEFLALLNEVGINPPKAAGLFVGVHASIINEKFYAF